MFCSQTTGNLSSYEISFSVTALTCLRFWILGKGAKSAHQVDDKVLLQSKVGVANTL